jgi:hypothetical protein
MHIQQTPGSGVDAPTSSAGDYSTRVRVSSKLDSFENLPNVQPEPTPDHREILDLAPLTSSPADEKSRIAQLREHWTIQTLPAERYWALKDSVGEASSHLLYAEHKTPKTAYVKELLPAIGHIAQARCLMMCTPSPYGRAYCNNLLLVGDILEKADRLLSRAICQAVAGKTREEITPMVAKARDLLNGAFQRLEHLDVVDQGNGGAK